MLRSRHLCACRVHNSVAAIFASAVTLVAQGLLPGLAAAVPHPPARSGGTSLTRDVLAAVSLVLAPVYYFVLPAPT